MTQSDQTDNRIIRLERQQQWAQVERSPSGYITLWLVTHEGRRGYVTMDQHQARELATALKKAIEG